MASGSREMPLTSTSKQHDEQSRQSIDSELRRLVVVTRKSNPRIFARAGSTAPGQVSGKFLSVHGRQFYMACASQLDTTSARSAISSIAVVCRRDWHSCCTSNCAEEMLAMRMIAEAAGLIVLLACHSLSQSYSETTGGSAPRNDGQSSSYYRNSESVAGTARLLTLFCRSCDLSHDGGRDVPLVSVLRDTLGDDEAENDRVTYIWLLTCARPRLGQRILSTIPFFYWRTGREPDRSRRAIPRLSWI